VPEDELPRSARVRPQPLLPRVGARAGAGAGGDDADDDADGKNSHGAMDASLDSFPQAAMHASLTNSRGDDARRMRGDTDDEEDEDEVEGGVAGMPSSVSANAGAKTSNRSPRRGADESSAPSAAFQP